MILGHIKQIKLTDSDEQIYTPDKLDQYNGCWCSISFHHQAISYHGMDYAG